MKRTGNVELAYMTSFFRRSILFSICKSCLRLKFVWANLKKVYYYYYLIE